VFVVASSRDDINLTEILFEFEGLRRDTPQSRKEGKVTPTISSSGTGVSRVGFNCEDEWFIETPVAASYTPSSIGGYREGIGTLRANGGDVGGGSENLVTAMLDHETVGALCADSHPGAYSGQDAYTGRLIPQPISVQAYENHPSDSRVKELGDISSTVRARWGTGGGNAPMVAQPMVWDTTNITSPQNGSNPKPGDPCFTLAKGQHPPLLTSMAVRRLTPVECERLQGFPDGYTNIPWRKAAESPDGPRYKALGNSWAVPVVAWIGKRIQDQIK
jgi:DNA (cytosine-5)-methyltransferase 1